MHFLYIQPGSGGSFYCQNCLRDLSVCDALRRSGHEVTMLPLYLPATADAAAPEDTPVFYSAVTLYLRHKYRWMRKLPRSWFRPLDTWPVLKLAAHFAGSTSASGLEDLTLSMLQGMEGCQAEDLKMLAEWIEALPQDDRPDVIILSNALLVGLAERLKKSADCAVLCWLQDEHVWTDAMHESLKQAVIKNMREDSKHVDRFIAVSRYYRDTMSQLLDVDPDQVPVIYPALDVEEYIPANMDSKPRRVGFLSRLAASDGFDVFVDAFIELRRNPQFSDVKLSATGGPSPDKNFMKRQVAKLHKAGLEDDADISPSRFARERKEFLSELTILSVPGEKVPEAFGYYAIEAMASGVPVVLPEHGAFPEFVNEEAGGCLFSSSEPKMIAETWAGILSSDKKLKELSSRARVVATEMFNESIVADKLMEIM